MQICTSIIGNAMPGPDFQQARTHIDEQIVLYVNYVGACERIYKTPIPIAFTVSTPKLQIHTLYFAVYAVLANMLCCLSREQG